MKFSVIYTVDVTDATSLRQFLPKLYLSGRRVWLCTEGDEERQYDYMGLAWKRGHHRKLCAVLTRKQFDAFIRDTGLVAEAVETQGSLGAPGFGVGWAPAVSFGNSDYDMICGAYVTPIPEVVTRGDRPFDERDWTRVRKAVLAVYG